MVIIDSLNTFKGQSCAFVADICCLKTVYLNLVTNMATLVNGCEERGSGRFDLSGIHPRQLIGILRIYVRLDIPWI